MNFDPMVVCLHQLLNVASTRYIAVNSSKTLYSNSGGKVKGSGGKGSFQLYTSLAGGYIYLSSFLGNITLHNNTYVAFQ